MSDRPVGRALGLGCAGISGFLLLCGLAVVTAGAGTRRLDAAGYEIAALALFGLLGSGVYLRSLRLPTELPQRELVPDVYGRMAAVRSVAWGWLWVWGLGLYAQINLAAAALTEANEPGTLATTRALITGVGVVAYAAFALWAVRPYRPAHELQPLWTGLGMALGILALGPWAGLHPALMLLGAFLTVGAPPLALGFHARRQRRMLAAGWSPDAPLARGEVARLVGVWAVLDVLVLAGAYLTR